MTFSYPSTRYLARTSRGCPGDLSGEGIDPSHAFDQDFQKGVLDVASGQVDRGFGLATVQLADAVAVEEDRGVVVQFRDRQPAEAVTEGILLGNGFGHIGR